ncbi:uncharacterized protein LOC115243104 [Formica exsecta]|uniref:uncharacterized protein LOC115243104 n=1 Tax=Formica exsecta TaxID=72781 RepID=UPI001141C059|nr:uncharacterized protein LOC115243104 [Formica exsecta]
MHAHDDDDAYLRYFVQQIQRGQVPHRVGSRLVRHFRVPRYNPRIQNHQLRTRIVVTGEKPDYYVAHEHGVDRVIVHIPFRAFVKIKCEENRCDEQNNYDEQRHDRLPKYSTNEFVTDLKELKGWIM